MHTVVVILAGHVERNSKLAILKADNRYLPLEISFRGRGRRIDNNAYPSMQHETNGAGEVGAGQNIAQMFDIGLRTDTRNRYVDVSIREELDCELIASQ